MLGLTCRNGHSFGCDDQTMDVDAELDGEILGDRGPVVFCPMCGASIRLDEARTEEQALSDEVSLADVTERRTRPKELRK